MNEPASTISINCPVCHSVCSDPPLYRYKVSEAAAHFCPATRNAHRNQRLEACIRRLWQGEESVVLRCQECGFAFGYPFIGGDEEFYSILHEQKGYPQWRWDYTIAITQALANNAGGKILEIGAGTGNFLRQLGPQWVCYAVEASDDNRKDLESHKIHVLHDLESAMNSEGGTFQAIVMFQVLEHLANFRDVLAQCHKLLSRGGKLVITVPYGEAMIRQEKLLGCHDMPPNHINKWTPQSLSYVLRDIGFEPSEPIFEPPSFQTFKMSLLMKINVDATKPHSIASQIYRIPYKGLRIPFLFCLGLPSLIRLLPHIKDLPQGGAFAMIAQARQPNSQSFAN
jgi:2-polyprenyl-3-methyl-5-hydroxy-6-metoxy-1,4-benzoquinol methylase